METSPSAGERLAHHPCLMSEEEGDVSGRGSWCRVLGGLLCLAISVFCIQLRLLAGTKH